MAYNLSSVEKEINHLKRFIRKLGTRNDQGQHVVTFGVLFDDDEAANTFEAIVGTLKAAKKRKIISFKGQMLLKGAHDNVPITLLKDNDLDSSDDQKQETLQSPFQSLNEQKTVSNQSGTNQVPPMNGKEVEDDKKENMVQIAGRCKSAGCKCEKYEESTSKWSKGKCKSCPHGEITHSLTWVKKSDQEEGGMKKEKKLKSVEVSKLQNLWGKEFTNGLSECMGKLFTFDEKSILPKKYILFYLKKVDQSIDFSGQKKHGDALHYVLMTNEQFGNRVLHPYGYNISLVE